MEKKIDIGKKGKIHIVWNINPINKTDEDEKKVIALMAKKYNVPSSNITLTTGYKNGESSDESLTSDIAVNIQDPRFQQKLFRQWLDTNGVKDYDFNEFLKIDSQVNSMIDYSLYDKSKRYQIKWVKWSNFLSYGDDNFFDFTKLHGLILLNGEPANESGKSTFAYDLLHFLLFGKTNQDKAKTNEQLFNNYRKDVNEVVVEGCIRIDGEDYVIKRTLSKKGKTKISVSQKVNYYRITNGINEELPDFENCEGASTQQTNKVIKEALGNEKDFDLIISANSKDLDELISMGETDRGKLLTRWIGLAPLEDKEVIAKGIKKELMKGRYCDMYNRTDVVDKNKALSDENESCSTEISTEEKRIADASEQIKSYNGQKETLLIAKREVDENLLKIDVTTLKATIQGIIEEGQNNKLLLQKEEAEFEKVKDVVFDAEEYKQLEEQKDGFVEKIAGIKANINQLKETNNLLEKQEFCPTCGKRLDNVDNTKVIEENSKKINELISEGVKIKGDMDKVVSRINELKDNRELDSSRSRIELKIMAIKSDIKDGRIAYLENKKLLDSFNSNLGAITKNNEIDANVNLINTTIKTFEDVIVHSNSLIASYKSTIERNQAEINRGNAIIAKIDEETTIERYWDLYLKMVGKDGICKMVLRNALPIINSELKNLLVDCSDFDVKISMSENNAIEFWLIRDGVKTRLSAASGLERTQAALALRVVLGKMSKLSCPPFLLLDEVLGTVSATNYDNMKKLYDKVVKLYDFVLHITHLDAIADWHNMTVTIVKEDNISSVKPLIIK